MLQDVRKFLTNGTNIFSNLNWEFWVRSWVNIRKFPIGTKDTYSMIHRNVYNHILEETFIMNKPP